MATKRCEDEKLDAATLDRVISLLEPADTSKKAITKKEPCEILNISYNTTRLGKLIEVHKEKKKRTAERRAALRGKPASKDEIVYCIGEYLAGEAVTNIAESMHRSTAMINRILEEYNVPIRAKSHDYFRPEMVPEGAQRDRFKVGEIVYSAQYDSTATIDAEYSHKDGWVYRVWLLSEKWHQYAYQPAWELASLEHLIALGVRV